MTTLLISHSDDPHVGLVTRQLDLIGRKYHLLQTDTIGGFTNPSVRISHQNQHIRLDGVDLDTITTVWNRRITINPGWSTNPDMDPLLVQHVHDQRLALFDGLASLLPPSAIWMNSIYGARLARSKIRQLAVAKDVGLAIPDTLVSNDAHEIRQFAGEHNATGLISKILSPTPARVPNVQPQYSIFTTFIDPRLIEDAELEASPAIYQTKVDKIREARTIVVGERTLTCAIDSQNSVQTKLDWRRYDFKNVRHYEIELPPPVQQMLVELTKRLGLRYSAIDLAQTHDGSWCFFELNPGGQWAWLEEIAGIPIGQLIAESL